MLLAEARAEIVRHARRLRPDGLVVGTAGNLSVRVGELLAVTPSGVDYDELTPELIGVHRMDGTAVEAELPPSSELPFHLAAYRAEGAAAVVHTHSVAATAVACLDGLSQLPPVHYYTAMFGGPLRIAPYETYGSAELAAGVEAALAGGRRGCLLANHGAVTVAGSLAAAYGLAQQLEWMCDVYLRTRAAGLPRALDAVQLEQATAKLAGYGRSQPGS
ncbi:class II aldolase/adducin family protein [Peterkaempfera bronchialis]|uniref:Class II aldolase/adducin family protein n=1 Tax=Peterkaempfera bronchialis TaxID=2126346 RepID=A0A345SZE8_9ACTN|nr:class II aldolase/adducin family protein [Peterkaempfera bronchialis]AXI79103.1 class II aldolase/adducin family protein [Peterkaempfera bronchialis]